jgi:hypothetical protein
MNSHKFRTSNQSFEPLPAQRKFRNAAAFTIQYFHTSASQCSPALLFLSTYIFNRTIINRDLSDCRVWTRYANRIECYRFFSFVLRQHASIPREARSLHTSDFVCDLVSYVLVACNKRKEVDSHSTTSCSRYWSSSEFPLLKSTGFLL